MNKRVPKRDEQRDRALIEDYKSGNLTSTELANKFHISVARLYQILSFYEIERRVHVKAKGKGGST